MRHLAALRRALLPVLVVIGFAAGPGCNNNRDIAGDGEVIPGDPAHPEYELVITPADASLSVDGKAPAMLNYRVLRKSGEDVTGQAELLLDDSRIGYFEGGLLTVRPGGAGKTMVRARLGEEEGATSLTVRVTVIVVSPGAPPDAPTKFGGTEDGSRAPELAYPPPGALVPPNLNELEIHFRPKDATLFEVRFVGDAIDLRVYTKCIANGSGCTLLTDDESWKWLSQAARNDTVQLFVRGSINDGAIVGTSAKQALSFASEDMKGGLYYWAASIGGIARYDFGLRGQKAEAFYGPLQAAAICVGCHAMSRDGKRVAVGMNIPGPASMRSLDTASRGKLFEVGPGVIAGSNYQAWTPDGKWLITTELGGLTVRDGTSGVVQGANPGLAWANMPDIAPDSRTVVFSRNITPQCLGPICMTLSNQGASLYTVEWKSDQTFGMPVMLAAADGMNNYYPSYSPDGRFVGYNRAAGDSYDAYDAKVMVVKATGGMPIDLTSVNSMSGNSWPKWSPFIHHFQKGTIMWLTFSSRRTYGVRNNTQAQIWMVPVDLAKLEAGQDSGYPPFRLPFQDLNTGNHIPSWVEKIERGSCKIPADCGTGETCNGGFCVPPIG